MLDTFEGRLQEYVYLHLKLFDIDFTSLRWSQFMVIITTHSDPTTGNLHMGPNNVGSVPVQDVASFLLS